MSYVTDSLLTLVVLLAVVVVSLSLAGARRTRAGRATSESEERFRLMVNRAPVMMWTARADASLDYLNRYCVEFAGLPLEKLLDNGWLEVVHPDDVEQAMGVYLPAFEARQPFVVEYRLRRADGTYRWFLDSGVPKYRPGGEFAGYIGACVDITERKTAEDTTRQGRLALEASHQEVQQLAGQLLTAYEDERRRLARELHDDLTQRLARLAIDAGRMENAPAAPAGMRPLREDLIRLSEDVHALSYRLHPSVLDDLGLVEALRTECDRVARHGAFRVQVDALDVPASLPGEASLCLFRVAQEALSNAGRHARASTVTVLLSASDNGVRLAVSDDGSGFDAARPRERASLGLASMRERVRLVRGELAIKSLPGRGTTVVAWVPAA